jgi:hypothetical protein
LVWPNPSPLLRGLVYIGLDYADPCLLGVVALIIEVLAIVFLEVVVVILVVISEVIYSN